MLVVDASCLFEVVTGGPSAAEVQAALDADADHSAPHVIDVEVLSTLRAHVRRGLLATKQAGFAVGRLEAWAGERFSHRPLLGRAWQLRDNVRGWDAMYVALAEALDAPLLTTDTRLAAADGPRCAFIVPGE